MSSFGLKPRLCGQYMLVPHERFNLYRVSHRKDGGEIPAALMSNYTSFEDFRAAAQRVHGDAYSERAIADQQKEIFNRINEARKRGEDYEL